MSEQTENPNEFNKVIKDFVNDLTDYVEENYG